MACYCTEEVEFKGRILEVHLRRCKVMAELTDPLRIIKGDSMEFTGKDLGEIENQAIKQIYKKHGGCPEEVYDRDDPNDYDTD